MKEEKKQIVLNFEIAIKEMDGRFIGECIELPGLIVSGASKNEVIKNMKAAIPLYLRYVPKESFIPVCENSISPIIYDFEEFNGFLYAATNKDVVLRTTTGDVGSWESINITNIFSPYFNPPVGKTKDFTTEDLGDYTPQIYCLKFFSDLGTPKLYCGTNATGGIYETLDGKKWSLSFNSGEARVHCLEVFKGKLFAGTSTEGKIYSYNGTNWLISNATTELAIVSFGLFRDYLYAGTYPNGIIFRTADGVNWQKVFDTNQSFVNSFCVFKNRLYAATSKASGALVFMSEDGTNWVENFFSEKDTNFFKFSVFANALYLGTGDNGKIYKTLDGKKWELAFQTDEEDIRALTVFNGYLYFGSSPKGRIFKTIESNVPPPKAYDVEISEITSHSAVITWKTDREASTIIEYGLDKNYGNNIINETKTVNHKITLNNLKALTTYHFRILTFSDMGSFSGILEDYSFTTGAAITPVISSKTHPDQNKWYSTQECELNWGIHPEVKSYYYLYDKNPETVPDISKCNITAKEGATVKLPEDGIWYFHLLIEDKAGNISTSVSHFTIRIDTSALPPEVFSTTHPDSSKWYNSNNIVLKWNPPEDLSGIDGYYFILDDLPGTVPNEKSGRFIHDTEISLKIHDDGVKYFHIISKDKSGNTGTKATHFRINIDTHSLPPIISSKTHPDTESWYNERKAEIHLAKPHDLSGIEGFYYYLDNNKTPDENADWIFTEAVDIKVEIKQDGVWYVHAKAKDIAGNVSKEISSFKLKVDTQALPPNISSLTHPDPNKWYNIKRAQFKIYPPDDLSGIEGYYYILDTKEKTVPGSTAVFIDKDTIFTPDLKDGEWYLHVVTKDKAGNIGTIASHFKFNIDTVAKPPKVFSKTHKDQEQWYNNPNPELHWETPEDLSGIEGYYYIVDDKQNTIPTKETGEWTKTNQIVIPLKEDGIYYFHIISKDYAGNTGFEAEHFRIKVDTKVESPRVTSITHPDENKWYNNPLVKLSWSVPQDLSKIKSFYYLLSEEKQLKINPGLATKTDKREVEFNLSEEGIYYFHIIGEDYAGNIGDEPTIFTIKIDLKAEPPDIISTTHPNPEKFYASTNPVFVVEKISDLSGAEGFYYIVDNNPETIPDKKTGRFTNDTTIKIPEKLEDGEWYFHIVLKDNAGNLGTKASHYKFKIETKPPEAYIKELPQFIASDTFEVKWTGTDKESGINCFTLEYKEGEKGKWKTWLLETKAQSGIFKGEDGITYYFRIKAKDNAGNWSDFFEDEKIKTTIDISPPSPITQIVAKPVAGGKISLEWNKSLDSISGLDFYRIYRSTSSGQLGMQINGDGETKDTKFIDESKELEDGIIYYYTVRAVDKIGNERESGNKQIFAICDRIALPPVITSITHPIQDQWYNHKNVKLTWNTPQDATKITGYYYIFDQIATTVPDAKTGNWLIDNEIDLNNVSDGTWFFHIISKDEAGNLSEEATHFRVNIDTTKPKPPVVTSITHSDANQWYNNNSPSFSWTVPSDPAGIEGYYYIFNQMKNIIPDITTASWTKGTIASFVDVPDGVWYFHIIAKDTAGNISEEAYHFQINVAMSPPPPSVFSSTHPEQEKWYRERNVKIQWKPAKYVNEIIGYYYILDNFENTIPTVKANKTMDTNVNFQDLKDGIYYFHIISVDKEGIIGKTAAHYKIKIKTKIALKGVITQSNGIMPLPGATVEVMKEDGTTLGVSISDKDGNYQIENLSVGKVKIKVLAKNLPPQMIYDIELTEDEAERILNISSEIFAIYEPVTGKIIFNYFIPENGTVTIKIYTENGKLINTIEEKKTGKIYNNSFWNVKDIEDGIYLYQITSKGEATGKLTRYAIRKIRKGK